MSLMANVCDRECAPPGPTPQVPGLVATNVACRGAQGDRAADRITRCIAQRIVHVRRREARWRRCVPTQRRTILPPAELGQHDAIVEGLVQADPQSNLAGWSRDDRPIAFLEAAPLCERLADLHRRVWRFLAQRRHVP